MDVCNIKSEELVVGKKYYLTVNSYMQIFFPEGGVIAEFDGLQSKFIITINGERSFFVGENVPFSPFGDDSLIFKIVAQKTGDKRWIKPDWIYYLVRA